MNDGDIIQRVGADWLEYLESTGNIERYDGLCGCYVCRQIRDNYWPWQSSKDAARHVCQVALPLP